MTLIAITGGIGSGKSIVARLVGVMGYEVYDCDSRAKALMTGDDEVRGKTIWPVTDSMPLFTLLQRAT